MKIVRLSKNLILFSLIFTMFFGIIDSFVMPTYAYASEVEEVTEEEEDTEDNTVTIGVHRSTNLKTNQQIFSDTVLRIGKIFFGFVVFVVIILTGINAITNSYDGKTRAQIIEKFKHIIYGVLLFAVAATIVAVAVNFQETLIEDLYDVDFIDVEAPTVDDSTLETNWLANILEMGFKIIGRLLEYVIQFLFNVVSCNVGTTGSMTQYDLNSILFLSDFGDVIDFSATNKAGMTLTTAPFTVEQWDRYTKAYFFLSAVAMPIMLIAIIKAAYDMIINAGNFEKAMTVKKTVLRMVAGIIIVVTGPYLFRTVLTFFNMIVYLIPVEFSFDIIIEDIDDANGLLSVITAFWWIWIKFKIMMLFTVRNIMLTVMYIVTPVVIGFWTLSEKTKAFNKWIGETVTNAAMQFCYAMVFFIATIVLSGAQTNAFFTLLWLSMMMKLAEFFREMFQNLFDKWSGINELGEAEKMLGTVSGAGWATVTTTTKLADKNGTSHVGVAVNNINAFKKGLKSGDWSGFTTRRNQLKLKNAEDLKDNAELLTNYKSQLDGSYRGINNQYGNVLASAFINDKETSEYSAYDDRLKGIKMTELTGAEKAYYYLDAVDNAFSDVSFEGREKDRYALAKRAEALAVKDYLKNENRGFYQIVSDQFDAQQEKDKLMREKAIIKAARKDETIPSIQEVTKQAAQRYIDRLAPAYGSPLPEKQAVNPLVSDSRLVSLKTSVDKLQSASKISLSDDYVKAMIANQGKDLSAVSIETERSNIAESISANITSANVARANQQRTTASLPEARKEAVAQDAVNTSKKALDSVLDAYRSNNAKLDANMTRQLQEFTKTLGANGEREEQAKYNALIDSLRKSN